MYTETQMDKYTYGNRGVQF